MPKKVTNENYDYGVLPTVTIRGKRMPGFTRRWNKIFRSKAGYDRFRDEWYAKHNPEYQVAPNADYTPNRNSILGSLEQAQEDAPIYVPRYSEIVNGRPNPGAGFMSGYDPIAGSFVFGVGGKAATPFVRPVINTARNAAVAYSLGSPGTYTSRVNPNITLTYIPSTNRLPNGRHSLAFYERPPKKISLQERNGIPKGYDRLEIEQPRNIDEFDSKGIRYNWYRRNGITLENDVPPVQVPNKVVEEIYQNDADIQALEKYYNTRGYSYGTGNPEEGGRWVTNNVGNRAESKIKELKNRKGLSEENKFDLETIENELYDKRMQDELNWYNWARFMGFEKYGGRVTPNMRRRIDSYAKYAY